MCNPVGYDRLKHLYIQKSSLAWRPLSVHFCAVSPRFIHDIWELIKILFSLLTPIQFIQPSLNHPAALPPPDRFSAPILFPVPLPNLFWFPVDLYHMNNFHGAVAPLHLLPRVIPCCLSLHDAEIQGSWPIRTTQEIDDLRRVYNLTLEVIRQYVQFGEFFNLLHAGATYLRVWQNGFGVVGVSTKQHSARSFARHPISWGLKKIRTVPYPDLTDTGNLNSDSKIHDEKYITIDHDFEAKRPVLRRQAQQWAQLEQDAKAEMFVFVGRWSMQKGIDLIAMSSLVCSRNTKTHS